MTSKLLLVLSFVLLGLALPALASCVNPFTCMCGVAGHVVIQAKVVDDTVGHGVVEVEAIDNPQGAALDLAVGATASAVLDGNFAGAVYKVGDHFLGTSQAPLPVFPVIRIDADGHVTCSSKPTFRPTVAQARAIMSSPDCAAAMNAAGFGAPTCNDVVVMNNPTCAAAPVGRSRLVLGLLLAACVVVGWRRRAASARTT